MYAVVKHACGRIDAEDLQALLDRSAAGQRAGAAPAYAVLALAQDLAQARGLVRRFKKEAKGGSESVKA